MNISTAILTAVLLFSLLSSSYAIAADTADELIADCRKGKTGACERAGRSLMSEDRLVEAREILLQGCAANDRNSCRMLWTLGKRYRDDESGPDNRAASRPANPGLTSSLRPRSTYSM